MANFSINIHQLYKKYVNWVASNPSSLGDVEMSVKWISYLVAGKIHNSSVVTELVYALSNLLVLFNDIIIEKANSTSQRSSGLERSIKMILTTMDYCEVFIELSAFKMYGPSGRWFFICVIQVIKCIGRLILTIFCNNNKIVKSPPIQQLDRKKIEPPAPTVENVSFQNENTSTNAYVLKRSGKVLRRIGGAPPVYSRSWKPLEEELKTPINPPSAGRLIKQAEILYILKPIIHLGTIKTFGFTSWKSFLTAFVIDFMSLRLYYKNREDLSRDQKLELSRRCVSLLLYLMRSPMYEKVTKDKIFGVLNGIGNNIPLTGTIMRLILSYIPHWQDTYFYMWST